MKNDSCFNHICVQQSLHSKFSANIEGIMKLDTFCNYFVCEKQIRALQHCISAISFPENFLPIKGKIISISHITFLCFSFKFNA